MSELDRLAYQVAAKDAAWPVLPIIQANLKTGEIVDVHKPAADIFGYEIAELLGKPIEILVPDALRDQHERWRQDVRVPKTRPMGQGRSILGKHKDGTLKQVFVGLTESSAQDIAVAFVVDLTGVVEMARVAAGPDDSAILGKRGGHR